MCRQPIRQGRAPKSASIAKSGGERPRGQAEPSAGTRRFLAMRVSFVAALALILAQSLAPPGLAQGVVGAGPSVVPRLAPGATHVQAGRIAYLDTATMNFVVQGNGALTRYWVARATRFRTGRRESSLFELRPGQPIEVMAHDSGRLEIADLVIF